MHVEAALDSIERQLDHELVVIVSAQASSHLPDVRQSDDARLERHGDDARPANGALRVNTSRLSTSAMYNTHAAHLKPRTRPSLGEACTKPVLPMDAPARPPSLHDTANCGTGARAADEPNRREACGCCRMKVDARTFTTARVRAREHASIVGDGIEKRDRFSFGCFTVASAVRGNLPGLA